MSGIVTFVRYLPVPALLLATALAEPAAAQVNVPLRGTVQTAEVLDITGFPTAVTSTGVGAGTATHLGKFTVSWKVVVDFTTPGGVATGPGVYTAANGDKLFTNLAGKGFPTDDPNVVFIVEEQTIVGGTGRFAGASGVFIRKSLANLATGLTSGSFSGAIVFAKSN